MSTVATVRPSNRPLQAHRELGTELSRLQAELAEYSARMKALTAEMSPIKKRAEQIENELLAVLTGYDGETIRCAEFTAQRTLEMSKQPAYKAAYEWAVGKLVGFDQSLGAAAVEFLEGTKKTAAKLYFICSQ